VRRSIVIIGVAALVACTHPAPREPASSPPPAVALSRSFACGEATCDAAHQYCEMIKTDDLRLPSTYACRDLPATCGAGAGAGCGCFPAATRCDYCARLDSGGVAHFQRTCVGGR